MSRVLYVEDEALLQIDGEASLTAAGYDVVVAGDGPEACGHLAERGARFDALITDIDLPGALTGWQVADLGRAISDRLSVIYVTGHAAGDYGALGVERSLIVPKPFAWLPMVASLAGLLMVAARRDRMAPPSALPMAP